MSRRARTVVATFAEWVLLALAWLLFSDSTDAAEIVVGLFVAGAGAVALHVVRVRKLAHVAPLPRCFAQAWRLPKLVFSGTWEISRVLFRQIFRREPAKSMLFATPYSAVGKGDDDATRRALATMYTSITPNFVIIDIDLERRYLLFHQLDESETPEMTRRLGAEA